MKTSIGSCKAQVAFMWLVCMGYDDQGRIIAEWQLHDVTRFPFYLVKHWALVKNWALLVYAVSLLNGNCTVEQNYPSI